ncbi:MAG: tRNA pseudouridine(13) synthase TruD, partial [Thermoplasmata archaeon]
MSAPLRPPTAEIDLGIGFYATNGPGTGGRLKVAPEDFRVREISQYPVPFDDGDFTILRVVARNWEQHELARHLAQRLGLPPGAVGWAGTKDRRAISEQLLSYPGAPRPLAREPAPGIEVVEMYRARRAIVLGQHFGNFFDLTVREVPLEGEAAEARWTEVAQALRERGAFPNFFGPQRFGEVRPVTHRVGRALLAGDSEGAVAIYLGAPTDGEPPEGREARQNYVEHGDPVRALREFPAYYTFERTLLDHLARGRGADRALRALPR